MLGHRGRQLGSAGLLAPPQRARRSGQHCGASAGARRGLVRRALGRALQRQLRAAPAGPSNQRYPI